MAHAALSGSEASGSRISENRHIIATMLKQLLVALSAVVACQGPTQTKPSTSLEDFAARLESLRAEGHIQAVSAVIAKGQSIAWSGSFGGTDGVSVTVGDTTVFHLASLTKPLASTVILQLELGAHRIRLERK